MADTVGRLVALLGLDATEYTRGLTRAERQAQTFARNTRDAILSVGAVLGSLAIGNEVLQATKAIIGEASALNDLADATGSSVEALSRLNNQAKIAGADFATLQTALLKLSQGMAGADDESNKTKEALKALGITTRDPVEALQQAAVKLTEFRDGVNKVGIAVALFGKQGAQFLATLKDVAELQDVGATVTARQAAEAEALEKAYRRLGVEATGFRNALLSQVVPALLEMIERMRDAQEVSGGLLRGILQFSSLDDQSFGTGIATLRKQIADLKKEKLEGKDLFGDLGPEIKLRENQLELLLRRQRRAAQALISPDNADARDLRLQQRPEAPALPGGPDRSRAVKAQRDEIEALIKSLERQRDAQLELSAEDEASAAIAEIRAKGIQKVTDAQEQQILQMARSIDLFKQQRKVQDETRKAEEEAARVRERQAEALQRSEDAARREVESIRQSNESIREQIIAITQGEDALVAYQQAQLLSAAAEREQQAAMLDTLPLFAELAAATREQAAALRERAALIGSANVARKLAEEARAIQNLQSQAFDVLAQPLEQFIVNGGRASDMLKQLERNILQFLTSEAIRGLKNAFQFGQNTGPTIFDILGKLIGVGLGSGGGGFSPGPQFGFAAAGGVHSGPTIVGERGPELLNLPPGTRVTPNHQVANALGGSVNNYINITVPAGTPTATAHQVAREVAFATSRAGRR